MSDVSQYLHELADVIGPRPATTDAEAQAADYIEETMRSRGLDVERHDFDCPRTYAWAFVIYHVLTIAAAAAGYWEFLLWPAFAVATIVAFTMRMDLDTRWGLSSLMPKGPSQNVLGKHYPQALRGESTRKVIIVAHYDSAKASLAFSPTMVRQFDVTFRLMKWCTYLVPVLILANALPFTEAADPYLWYATLVLAAYLLVPLIINVHRELFMRATDGANDNASGVATMLGLVDEVSPEGQADTMGTTQPIRRTPEAAQHADVVPEGAVLSYTPAGTPEEDLTQLPDDFTWAETTPESERQPSQGQKSLEFDTIEFDAIGPETAAPSRAPRPSAGLDAGGIDSGLADDGLADDGWAGIGTGADEEALFGTPEQQKAVAPPEPADDEQKPRGLRGLWSRSRKRGGGDESPTGWLGVDDEFDARDEGRKIGSWDGFEEEGDDDLGFKGGQAGDDPIGDDDFAENAAARIRKRVIDNVDRALAEKEIWFLGTGAEEAGTWGMRAFLSEYADELRGAHIINLDNLGAGTLHYVTQEGMAKRYTSDRRLQSTAKRVAREEEMLVKGRPYRGLSTDATPALARKRKAISIMAFDINGRLPNWHWRTDTSDNVQIENITNAVKLVTGMIREL